MIQNLSSLLDLTREEREESVIALYKEGKTTREIAKLMRMSLRDIGATLKKEKLQADQERGYTEVDTEPKSPESKALKMFSEGKSPLDVAIKLDLDAGTVRAMYYHYWELKGKYELAQIYDELGGSNNLISLIKIHKIFKDLGMNEHDMIKVLELAKHNELERLQWKAEYLRNEIFILQDQKTKAINHISKLNKMNWRQN